MIQINIIIILSILLTIIISFIPNFTYNTIYLFNYQYVRILFIILITYLTFVDIEYSIYIMILFLIMLEISNKMFLNKI